MIIIIIIDPICPQAKDLGEHKPGRIKPGRIKPGPPLTTSSYLGSILDVPKPKRNGLVKKIGPFSKRKNPL